MEVVCEYCRAKLNIPDEKLPEGQKVGVACPKCRSKLVIERPGPKRKEIADEEPVRMAPGEDYEYSEDDSAIDLYGEGVRLALIMESDAGHVGKLQKVMEELGCRPVLAKDTRDALGKMRFHHFSLAILGDQFEGMPLNQSPILHYLNHLSMSLRRRMFLTLIGSRFKTMDNMTAFAMSANLVVNPRDLERLATVLKKSLKEYERFYKVFMETLAEVGKA